MPALLLINIIIEFVKSINSSQPWNFETNQTADTKNNVSQIVRLASKVIPPVH